MIETATSRRQARRRLARRNNKALDALHVTSAMCRGAALLLHFDRRVGAVWRLADGRDIDAEVAEAVLKNPHVIGVGDTLFDGTRSQTYRYVGN